MPLKILILLVSVTFIWGYSWVAMKVALDYMGPFTFSAIRFGLGAIIMILVLYFKRMGFPKRSDWPYLILLGFVQTTLEFSLVMYGMKFVTAGKSSILLYTMPVWSMILAYFFLSEKITERKIISIILGTIGLIFIIGSDFWYEQSLKSIFGEFLIVLGAAAWGIANIINKKKFINHNMLMIAAWQMAFGSIGLAINALIFERSVSVELTPLAIFSILFCSILGSAYCFAAWYTILTKVDTTVASVSLLFVPVVALFGGWIQLNETITTGTIIGSLLITLSIYFSHTAGKKEKPAGTVRESKYDIN